jgi:hypothetical protein
MNCFELSRMQIAGVSFPCVWRGQSLPENWPKCQALRWRACRSI